ncbi:MAG: acetaldehyde dehydrogenase (acetylating) [Thermodesulfobacteriota bacterium]
MDKKVKVGILGPGNIGTDLMFKIMRNPYLEVEVVSGIVPNSQGLALAQKHGFKTSLEGVNGVLNGNCRIVFEATSARSHQANAPLFERAGKIAIDLTPAAVGPYVVPSVNLGAHLDKTNVNLITCGGQATIPIVAAISRVTPVRYGEIVASIASKSAGPGTRQNIDEFTQTTSRGVEIIGGAGKGKAIIILNPADPPITMRDTVHALVENPDQAAITRSVEDMVKRVQQYVPGYHLKLAPWFDGDRVTVILEIEGAGDYLPKYSGNLDIMTSAAVAVGEGYARQLSGRP